MATARKAITAIGKMITIGDMVSSCAGGDSGGGGASTVSEMVAGGRIQATF